MDLVVWETYTKYQRSWPLQKCKHEVKYEEARALRLAELERQRRVRAAERERRRKAKFSEVEDELSSTTTDPDRLSIRLVINELVQERATDDREEQEIKKQRYYDNHTKLAASSKRGQANADKVERKTNVSKFSRTDFSLKKKHHTRKAKKKTSKKWGEWREYIWQNDFDLFHSQQKNGIMVNNSSGGPSGNHPVTAMEKVGGTSSVADYRESSEREYNRLVRRNAATVIQSAVRGWLTRHLLQKLSVKSSQMDMPWRTFARDYLKLLDKVRARNLTIRRRPPLNLLAMYKYTSKQEYFDEAFDSITGLILDKSMLAEFVKRCDIRVAPRDIEDSYRYVFKGVPEISVSLLVEINISSSFKNLKSPVEIAKEIRKKLSTAAFIKEVTFTTDIDNVISTANSECSAENKVTREFKVLCSSEVTKRQVSIMVLQEDREGGFKRLFELHKQKGVPVFLIALGSGELSEMKYTIPSRRTYHITSNRMWNQNADNILEDIFKQAKKCYPLPSSDNITKQLHRREANEIAWTLQPPPGSGCPTRNKIVNMYSVAEIMDSCSLPNEVGFDFEKMSLT